VDAARVIRLRSQGRTIREIADALGVSRSLVHKTLANREIIDAAIKTG
jgi:DNA-binding CsgD family transcriptional regulator